MSNKITGPVDGETMVIFKIEYHWTPEGLTIECPSIAARDFVARVLDEQPLVIRVRRRG